MADSFQVRDVFNAEAITQLADTLQQAWPDFNHGRFCDRIVPQLPELSFSGRLHGIAEALEAELPADFPAAADILLRTLPQPLGFNGDEPLGGGFIYASVCEYVSRRGRGHFELSMRLLYALTQRFSAEWAIRLFLEEAPERTLAVLQTWTADPSPHVRRLVSEGTRPLLPWGKRLPAFAADPSPTLALLEHLKNDPSEYVRRSVANHLNDHAKKHPEVVVSTLTRWRSEHPTPAMNKLVRHALRTLIKNGHAGALAVLGFADEVEVSLKELQADAEVAVGDSLSFSFVLESLSDRPQPLVVDYVVHFRKANGSLQPKVFKLKNLTLRPGERVVIGKRHSFRPITTRVYYPGGHELALQVNGKEMGRRGFVLRQES